MAKILQFKRSLDYYLKLLDTRLNERDFLGALDAGRNALSSSKTRIDRESINLILSEIYFEMGQYVLSCEYAFYAIKIPETRASAMFCVGKSLVMLKKYNQALDYFAAVLEWNVEENLVGAVLEWSKEIKTRLMAGKKNDRIDDLIKSLMYKRHFEEALELVRPLLDSGGIKYRIIYCDILVQMGEYSEAREILFNILLFDSENVEALLVLSALCLAEKDYSSLGINTEKLKNLSLNAAQLVILGNILAKSENYSAAIEAYQKILAIDEYNIKILLYVSLCWYNLGNQKEALYYLGRARWVDLDNPVLNIFYQIIDTKSQKNLDICAAVPYEVGQAKVDDVYEALNLSNFAEIFCTSPTLSNDIEWCLMLKNTLLGQLIAQNLAKSSKKEIIKFYQRLLLTTRIEGKQKFLLTKYAFASGNLKSVDFTFNLNYKSFRLKIPKIVGENEICRLGYCGAVSFAEIYNISVDFDKIGKKISSQELCSIDYQITENLISCLYFCENGRILEQACVFFDTPKSEVISAIKSLKLL